MYRQEQNNNLREKRGQGVTYYAIARVRLTLDPAIMSILIAWKLGQEIMAVINL